MSKSSLSLHAEEEEAVTAVLTSSCGSYPRIGESAHDQRLRRAYADLEIGRIAEGDYRALEDAVVAEVLAEQSALGLDLVTDGLVRWYDPISHTARKLAGVTINGLLRFFDNNFYFRQPVVRDRITKIAAIVTAEYRFAARTAPRPVKAVLTGPYTLARHSLVASSHYPSLASLTLAYAGILAEETADLAAAGARHIQIDEPAILRVPSDLGLLARALTPIAAAKGSAELTLATYFGDAAPIFDALQELPVDVLGVDLASSRTLESRLRDQGARYKLALGILDGRNTRLEDVATAAATVAAIATRTRLRPLYLTTSCGLEYLPREAARRKLERLVAIRRAVDEAGT